MLRIPRAALFSAAAVALALLGLNWLLESWLLPRMRERGNVVMVQALVSPLESYFADYQEWPGGTSEEIMWRLSGAKNDVIGEQGDGGAPVSLTEIGAPKSIAGTTPGEAPTVRRERLLPSVNYLRQAGDHVRAVGLTLGDAWGRPLEFTFIPAGSATVTSIGADGVLGTADDVTATAHIRPRIIQPSRALFVADREFRRSMEVKRLQQARKLAEKRR